MYVWYMCLSVYIWCVCACMCMVMCECGYMCHRMCAEVRGQWLLVLAFFHWIWDRISLFPAVWTRLIFPQASEDAPVSGSRVSTEALILQIYTTMPNFRWVLVDSNSGSHTCQASILHTLWSPLFYVLNWGCPFGWREPIWLHANDSAYSMKCACFNDSKKSVKKLTPFLTWPHESECACSEVAEMLRMLRTLEVELNATLSSRVGPQGHCGPWAEPGEAACPHLSQAGALQIPKVLEIRNDITTESDLFTS